MSIEKYDVPESSIDGHFYIDEKFRLWEPADAFGLTWLPTHVGGTRESYSLFDIDGELLGDVYQRDQHVLCWAPYAGGKVVYSSDRDLDDVGFKTPAQRLRHFEKITSALCEWARQIDEAGADLPLFRDEFVYQREVDGPDQRMTCEEFAFRPACGEFLRAEDEEAQAIKIAGWKAVPDTAACFEAYRLRDATGRLRGRVQVRYGVVRAVAVQPEDADRADPLRRVACNRHCRGQIVLREKTAPMSIRLRHRERVGWLQRAVEAVCNAHLPGSG